MELNKMISKVGSAIVTVTVFLFAFFFDNRFFYGRLLCLPYPAGRVYHDDCRSA